MSNGNKFDPLNLDFVNPSSVAQGGTGATTAAAARTALGGVLTASNIITRETPSGAIDSVNAVFTLAFTPTTGTEMVYLNGLLQDAGTDYAISTVTITFAVAPTTGDRLRVSYIKP